MLVSVFPILAGQVFAVSWTDDDGYIISIDSDEELILAITEMPGPVYNRLPSSLALQCHSFKKAYNCWFNFGTNNYFLQFKPYLLMENCL